MNLKDVEKAIHGPEMLKSFPELKDVQPADLMALIKLNGRYEHMTFKNIKLFAAGIVYGMRLAEGKL